VTTINDLNDGDALGGRLPLLRPAELTGDQRSVYDYLQESKISWANSAPSKPKQMMGVLSGPSMGSCTVPRSVVHSTD